MTNQHTEDRYRRPISQPLFEALRDIEENRTADTPQEQLQAAVDAGLAKWVGQVIQLTTAGSYRLKWQAQPGTEPAGS